MQRSPQPVSGLEVEWPASDQRSCLITFKLPMPIDITSSSDSCVANLNKTIGISYATMSKSKNNNLTSDKAKVNLFYTKSFNFIKTLNIKNIA